MRTRLVDYVKVVRHDVRVDWLCKPESIWPQLHQTEGSAAAIHHAALIKTTLGRLDAARSKRHVVVIAVAGIGAESGDRLHRAPRRAPGLGRDEWVLLGRHVTPPSGEQGNSTRE